MAINILVSENHINMVKKHIFPVWDKKKITYVTQRDVQKLFNTKADYSSTSAEPVKTIRNVSFCYAVTNKVISTSLADGIRLPKAEKSQEKSGFIIWVISVVPLMAGQEAKGFIAGIIADGVPEIEIVKKEWLEMMADATEFLPYAG